MSLPNDMSRCNGSRCPSRMVCQRFLDRGEKGVIIPFAAFDHRREAGSSACDHFIRVGVDVLRLEIE